MKILFQNIGTLVGYNWALPFYMLNEDADLEITSLCNLFSYLMGGFYYHFKIVSKVHLLFYGTGIKMVEVPVEKALVYYIRSKNFDILHLNSLNSLTMSFLNERGAKVFTFHGSLDKISFEDKEEKPQCKLENIYSNVDAFVAVSEHSAKTIREICGFNPYVIHNGVDISIFNPSHPKIEARRKLRLPPSKKIVLWNARISPEKKLETLIKAIPRIVKEFDDIIFLIKGRTPDKKYALFIKHLIRKLNVESYIKFILRWTPNIQMIYYYYRASDIYVHTSISEGFSLTLLEAMASGVPVIGNNSSSIPEAIGDAGLLYQGSAEDLADKILKLLFDEKLARKLAGKAFLRIRERGLTWRDSAKKYLHLYSRLS